MTGYSSFAQSLTKIDLFVLRNENAGLAGGGEAACHEIIFVL
jgi:hypothetical protein